MAALARQLGWTVAVQASGAAATLAAAAWIGLALGPQAQGRFNALKSLVELGAALAMLGMPQALYVFAQRGAIGLERARTIATRVAWLGLPVGMVLALAAPAGGGIVLALLVALAVALAALQGPWRALALLAPRSLGFNLATVAPQWSLLGVAALVVAAGRAEPPVLAAGLAVAWALGCLAARRALRAVPPVTPDGSADVRFGALLRHGAANGATASLAAAGIVLLQRAALQAGGESGLGQVSMAMLLAQVPVTPLNYVLPLLLRHRVRESGSRALAGRLPLVALPMLALAAATLALGRWRSDLGMGPGYAHLDGLLAWLLVAGAAEAALRLLAVDAQADGRPWHATAAEMLRVLAFGAMLLGSVVAGEAGALPAVVRAWAVASGVAAAAWWLALRRRAR